MLLRPLKLELFIYFTNFIHSRKWNVDKIEEMRNYMRQLPTILLDEWFFWILCIAHRSRENINYYYDDQCSHIYPQLSAEEVAICFHSQKRTLWLKTRSQFFDFSLFLNSIPKNLFMNLTKLMLPKGCVIQEYEFKQLCKSVSSNLQILSLSNTTLRTGCLKHLSLFLCLQELDLSYTDTSNLQLEELFKQSCGCFLKKTLRVLNTIDTEVTLFGHLSIIIFFPNLEWLITEYSTINLLLQSTTQQSLRSIISGFDYWGSPNDDRMLKRAFMASPTANKVKIMLHKVVTSETLNGLESLKPHLQYLTLKHISCLDFKQILPALISISENLKMLSLSNIKLDSHHSDISLNFPNLHYLKLEETYNGSLSESPIAAKILIAFLMGSQNLVSLKMQFCSNLSNDVIFQTFTNNSLKYLKKLKLYCCINVQSTGIVFLLDKTSLRKLTVIGSIINPVEIKKRFIEYPNNWIILDLYMCSLRVVNSV